MTDLFARYGYAVVFFGVFLENTGLPVPGETALLAGAAMAQYGWLSLPRVILTAIAAATIRKNSKNPRVGNSISVQTTAMTREKR